MIASVQPRHVCVILVALAAALMAGTALADDSSTQKLPGVSDDYRIAKPAPQPEPTAKVAAELRPSKPAPAAAPQPLRQQPANDDRQKDYRAVLAQMNRRAPSTIYWLVAALSVIWVAGGLMLGHLLYAPGIWQIRSVGAAMAGAMTFALGLGIVLSAAWRSGPRQEREALAVHTPTHELGAPAAPVTPSSSQGQSPSLGDVAPVLEPSAGSLEAPGNTNSLAVPPGSTPSVAAGTAGAATVVAPAAPAPVEDKNTALAELKGTPTAVSRTDDAAVPSSSVPTPAARATVKAAVRPAVAAPVKQHPAQPARPATKAKAGAASPPGGASVSGATPESGAEHWVDPWAN